jgi:hypothetical protein
MATRSPPHRDRRSGRQARRQDVVVGAYAYVGGDVTLGDRCVLHHHATVDGCTQLGPQCEVFPYAFIGGRTQDLKARPGSPASRSAPATSSANTSASTSAPRKANGTMPRRRQRAAGLFAHRA